LLVFGTYTESEVIEKVEGKDGTVTDKKVKKYDFDPMPVQAAITGGGTTDTLFSRDLLIHGAIGNQWRVLGEFGGNPKVGPTKVFDMKANVSRTVTELVSRMKSQIEGSTDHIEKLKTNVPKLEKLINTPFAQKGELETKERELREVNARIAERGVSHDDPAEGIPIGKYKAAVPVLRMWRLKMNGGEQSWMGLFIRHRPRAWVFAAVRNSTLS